MPSYHKSTVINVGFFQDSEGLQKGDFLNISQNDSVNIDEIGSNGSNNSNNNSKNSKRSSKEKEGKKGGNPYSIRMIIEKEKSLGLLL